MYSSPRSFRLLPDRLDLSEMCEMLHGANIGLDVALGATMSHLRQEVFSNSMFMNMVDLDGEEMRNLLGEIKTIIENDHVIEMESFGERRRRNATDSNCSENSSNISSCSDGPMATAIEAEQQSMPETIHLSDSQFSNLIWKSQDNLEKADDKTVETEDIGESQQSMIFTVSSSTDLSSSSYGNCDADNDEEYDADDGGEAAELKQPNGTFENCNNNNSNNNENNSNNNNNKDDNGDDDDDRSGLVSSSMTSLDEDDINQDVQRLRDLLQVEHAAHMTKRKYCFWHAVKNFQLAELNRYWSNTKPPLLYQRPDEKESENKLDIVGLAELLTTLCFKLETVILHQKVRKSISKYKEIDNMMLAMYKNHCDGEVCRRLVELWRVETDAEEIISFLTWNSKKEWYSSNLWACFKNEPKKRSTKSESSTKTTPPWQPEPSRSEVNPKYVRAGSSLFESQSRSWRSSSRNSALRNDFESDYRRRSEDLSRDNSLRKSYSTYSGFGSTRPDYTGRRHWKEILTSKKLNLPFKSNSGHYPKYSYMARRRWERMQK